jgi:hypothetical protein
LGAEAAAVFAQSPEPIDTSQTLVTARAAVRNPDPASGGPLLPLSGWHFAASFEGAKVVRSQTVTQLTDENDEPAFWDIEFTGDGPANAAVTSVPRGRARLIEVQCVWFFLDEIDEHSFTPSLRGTTISFDVVRGEQSQRGYDCHFVYDSSTVIDSSKPPQTDTLVAQTGARDVALAILTGLVAGAYVLTRRPSRPARTVRG